MDVIDAIKERKSIRAFKPEPVKLDLLKKIIAQGLMAPSWADTQPWEFAIAGGKKLKAIQDAFIKLGLEGMKDSKPEVARPYEFPEPYVSRIQKLQTKEQKGRAKEATKEEMEARFAANFRHYGAPACIYLLLGKNIVYQEKGVNVWSLYDSGAAVENIMLAATNYGLGTIAQAMAVAYPDIIRKELGIPDDKLIALGIAIGYPDKDDPAYQFRAPKEPLETMARFYGF
jgi:nitroreductase